MLTSPSTKKHARRRPRPVASMAGSPLQASFPPQRRLPTTSLWNKASDDNFDLSPPTTLESFSDCIEHSAPNDRSGFADP